jgi:hypothetical protein
MIALLLAKHLLELHLALALGAGRSYDLGHDSSLSAKAEAFAVPVCFEVGE